ncbi:MAG: 50S ribosomal protein L30 [archaeon]|nr:MAG: 50S ribosomal protein L30 [archaeon]
MKINLVKELRGKKYIFGLKRTLKLLKKKLVEKIYLALDAPEIKKQKGVDIVKLDDNKETIKETLKKNFNISVIAVIKNES